MHLLIFHRILLHLKILIDQLSFLLFPIPKVQNVNNNLETFFPSARLLTGDSTKNEDAIFSEVFRVFCFIFILMRLCTFAFEGANFLEVFWVFCLIFILVRLGTFAFEKANFVSWKINKSNDLSLCYLTQLAPSSVNIQLE